MATQESARVRARSSASRAVLAGAAQCLGRIASQTLPSCGEAYGLVLARTHARAALEYSPSPAASPQLHVIVVAAARAVVLAASQGPPRAPVHAQGPSAVAWELVFLARAQD